VSGDNIQGLLRRSTDRFIEGVAGISAAQFLFRPGAGRWSASEITEHVTIANIGIHARLAKGLEPLASPASVADDEIPYLFYRGDEPPNVAAPTGSWTEVDGAIDAFADSAARLISWRAETDHDLRACGASHPVFGVLDAYQWLLFAQAHTERHRAEFIGLVSRPGFPVDA
jgi:hypothetical protein